MNDNTVSRLCSVGTLFLGSIFLNATTLVPVHQNHTASLSSPSPHTSTHWIKDAQKEKSPDLVSAAKKATPAVVHIKVTQDMKGAYHSMRKDTPFDQLFKEFFGEEFNPTPKNNRPQQTAGSGVIITKDGYIVTNNHVIEGASHIEITLDDNRRYQATIIGQDPSTDLALLKIEADHLPYLEFGNSNTLQVGEWVLAVGNPFNLTSTVTKGIVSAKARKISGESNKHQVNVEAFIQTDAAVNPGNSGGALVNIHGELVGINTAITTNTGSFTGYSFAIPASIAQKITEDLKKHGIVQRAMLGIKIQDVNADLAEHNNLNVLSGAYVNDVESNGAAKKAGICKGDVITAVGKQEVHNSAELQEQVALYKPGDKICLTYYRKQKKLEVYITLGGLKNACTFKVSRVSGGVKISGAAFEDTPKTIQKELNITGGVRIKTLRKGIWEKGGIPKGFVITSINGYDIEHLDQFVHVFNSNCRKKALLVEGYLKKGHPTYFAIQLATQ